MNELLNAINYAIAQDAYFAALFTALSVPDICGAIESVDGQATGMKYQDWFDRYVASKYAGWGGEIFLTGFDCYYFRCSLLHQGLTNHRKSRHRIVFVEPPDAIHNNIIHASSAPVLQLRIDIFCGDIVDAARTWLPTVQNVPHAQINLANSIQRYPMGNWGINGMPLIG
ncbi:hypothetical protein K8I61_00780 [bacterium]|nr:hypothetical protein [bacterium]